MFQKKIMTSRYVQCCSVNVVSAAGTTLVVTSFTMAETGQPTALDPCPVTQDYGANKYIAGNAVFLLDKAPFKPDTVYSVELSGVVK